MTRSNLMMACLIGILAGALAGCARIETPSEKSEAGIMTEAQPAQDNVVSAVCVLTPTLGNQARGVVTFTKEGNGVKVVAHIEGLTPGEHGFHIHEFGDCSAQDASSAGGHFNPTSKQHGGLHDMEHHVGDFGNITAGEDGSAHAEIMSSELSFGGASSIIGRGLIVHAQPDDLKTQPTGNSGGRVACGVIGIGK